MNEGVSSNEKTMAEVISKTVGGQYHEGVKGATEHVIGGGVQEEHGDEYRKAVSLSRRTVGLQTIDAFDLMRQRKEQYGGAQTEQEERVLAVREFLNLETKLDSRTIDEMEIERIFAPAKGDKECLYVTFKQESSVNKIFEKTRYMRKESRILLYVPKQFYERFSKLSSYGYNIRKEEKCQTRIKMGQKDLMLFRRFRGEQWEQVPLPGDLPEVDLNSSSRQAEPGSPAPGRPSKGREAAEMRDGDEDISAQQVEIGNETTDQNNVLPKVSSQILSEDSTDI